MQRMSVVCLSTQNASAPLFLERFYSRLVYWIDLCEHHIACTKNWIWPPKTAPEGQNRQFHCHCLVCRLLVDSLTKQSGIFEGPPESVVFSHSMRLMKDSMYRTAGRLLALSLAQGGCGLHCMSEAVYRYWTGLPFDESLLHLDLVNDCEMKRKIQAVCKWLSAVFCWRGDTAKSIFAVSPLDTCRHCLFHSL